MQMTKLEPVTEFPFVPTYDAAMPTELPEEERGILCVRLRPTSGVDTVRVDADICDIMKKIGMVTTISGHLKFYNLGSKMIIMHTESHTSYEDALIYNGEGITINGIALICNREFKSLTQMEALNIMSTARISLPMMRVSIRIEE